MPSNSLAFRFMPIPSLLVDVLIITAASGEDDAVRSVRVGRLQPWDKLPTERKPRGFLYRLWYSAFERDAKPPLRIILAETPDQREHATAGIAAPLISHFNPFCVAMCGVCAGRPGHVNLGDVIIAEKVWKYDAGAAVLAPGATNAEIYPEIETYQLPKHWKRPAESFSCSLPNAKWKRERPIPMDGEAWSIRVGGIATGKDLVRDPTIWDRLAKNQNRKILGIEMEASAVGWVAEAYDVRRKIVVKGAMDHGDGSKSDKCRRFAARAAAEVLLRFLRAHVDNDRERPWFCGGTFDGLNEVDGTAADTLTTMALQGQRDEVFLWLTGRLASARPSERYWIYVTLGKVGGPGTKEELDRGLQEKNRHARRGALDGHRILSAARALHD